MKELKKEERLGPQNPCPSCGWGLRTPSKGEKSTASVANLNGKFMNGICDRCATSNKALVEVLGVVSCTWEAPGVGLGIEFDQATPWGPIYAIEGSRIPKDEVFRLRWRDPENVDEQGGLDSLLGREILAVAGTATEGAILEEVEFLIRNATYPLTIALGEDVLGFAQDRAEKKLEMQMRARAPSIPFSLGG